MIKIRRKRNQIEDGIQAEIIDLLRVSAIPDLIFFSVPNGGRRAWSVAKTMKNTGQLKGVTDLVLVHPETGIAHFLEIKRDDGHLTKEQREFRNKCHALDHPWAVVHSRDQAQDILHIWGLIRVVRKIAA